MSVLHPVLMRMFGRPRGILGSLGGVVMARSNADCGAWVIELLELSPTDAVLEVGFGPGVALRRLSGVAGHVVGIDPSREMVAQARARNADAIAAGRIELRCGSAHSLPFESDSFDKAMAVNSMQVWPDAVAGLREIRRVLKSAGSVAMGFTPYSGQPNRGLAEKLTAAGFTAARTVEKDKNFCALAIKPKRATAGFDQIDPAARHQ